MKRNRNKLTWLLLAMVLILIFSGSGDFIKDSSNDFLIRQSTSELNLHTVEVIQGISKYALAGMLSIVIMFFPTKIGDSKSHSREKDNIEITHRSMLTHIKGEIGMSQYCKNLGFTNGILVDELSNYRNELCQIALYKMPENLRNKIKITDFNIYPSFDCDLEFNVSFIHNTSQKLDAIDLDNFRKIIKYLLKEKFDKINHAQTKPKSSSELKDNIKLVITDQFEAARLLIKQNS